MKQLIEVINTEHYVETEEENGDAFEVWIEFLDWHIVLSLKDGDDSIANEEITIVAKQYGDVTADFFAYSGGKNTAVMPTGMNLYQVMNLLLTNYKLKQKKEDDK